MYAYSILIPNISMRGAEQSHKVLCTDLVNGANGSIASVHILSTHWQPNLRNHFHAHKSTLSHQQLIERFRSLLLLDDSISPSRGKASTKQLSTSAVHIIIILILVRSMHAHAHAHK